MGRPSNRSVIAEEVRRYLEEAQPPHVTVPRAQVEMVAPSLPLVHHVYTAEAFGGHVLPRKPYSLPLPACAKGAIAAHVAVISDRPSRMRLEYACVRGDDVWIEFSGEGVAAGISVLFVMPG